MCLCCLQSITQRCSGEWEFESYQIESQDSQSHIGTAVFVLLRFLKLEVWLLTHFSFCTFHHPQILIWQSHCYKTNRQQMGNVNTTYYIVITGQYSASILVRKRLCVRIWALTNSLADSWGRFKFLSSVRSSNSALLKSYIFKLWK